MEAGVDIHPGELYLFPQRSRNSIYEFHGVEEDDRYLFVSKSGSSTLRLPPEQFLDLRNTPNGAVRIRTSGPEQTGSFVYTDPATFLDPNTPGLPQRERQRIATLKKDRRWALTVQFFTLTFDETPGIRLSELALASFIRSHAAEAERLGLERSISASTLRRAIHNCGVPGDRALHYFLPDKERERGPFWDPYILLLKAELIDEYWSPAKPRLADAQDEFRRKLRAKNKELQSIGADPLARPTDETMRLWIKGAECYHRYSARHGKRAAGRRFRGQSRAIQASRPLEYVMFDHTRADGWANVEDENGKTITQERPWLMLAVDVFSMVILAAILTYEPPSIYSVAMGLKQLIRPKDFLPPDLQEFKNFYDLWGKPSFIIVDRAWENTEVSFQTICESVGINIIWAPVRTPEFKCHVEHAFHLLNSIYWHRLPSGIPHKPHIMTQRGLDPRKNADRSIQKMNDGLWYAIRKLAFRVNDAIGMAPARAWQEGVRNHGRPMIDDVTAFDTFIGKVRQCQLSTSGIRLENQRFHDPKITSTLLNDLLRYAKASRQRRAPNSSGTVHVHVTIDPETCEYIYVWNPKARRNVRLPNILPRFSAGLSWQGAKACREYANKENLAFCSEDEMLEVSTTLMAAYKSQLDDQPFREKRKAARKYRPRAQLARGTIVEEAWEEPSATGMGAKSIPNVLPARERGDERKVLKSARRGGVAASKKATKARKDKQEQKRQASNPTSTPPHPKDRPASSMWVSFDESAARLKRIAEALGEEVPC